MCPMPMASCLAVVLLTISGCAGDMQVEQARAPVVYGADGRQDHYEAADPAFARLLREATVALVDPLYIDVSDAGNVVPDTVTLGDYKDLCDGERFADQPAMSSCSGTLIDDDLVLTAAHCVDQTVCNDWYFVFGYYMTADGVLNHITSADVYTCAEILVHEYTEYNGADAWHDYAILRLDRPVEGNRAPATVVLQTGHVQVGQGITALGFGNGIPGKVHTGGSVTRANEQWGYFHGSTDTFGGNSGSGTYNDAHELVGVFVRGGDEDYVQSGGCFVTNVVDESGASQEYDYAYKAVDDLCASGYQSARLCPDGPPIQEPDEDTGGCQASPSATGPAPGQLLFMVLALILLLYRRHRRHR